MPFLLPYLKEELLGRQRNTCVDKLLDIFIESLNKLEKKQWVVGAHEILRLRIIVDVVVETITSG